MINRWRLEDAMRGIDFPASRDEILDHVRTQPVDPEEMMFFDAIPDVHYGGPDQLREAVDDSWQAAGDEFRESLGEVDPLGP